MENREKLDAFLEIAGCFNETLGSVPILYGSLGLSEALSKEIVTSDIDVLVEVSIFTSCFDAIRTLMKEMGYMLTDTDENEFQRGSLRVGISHDGDMIDFSGVNPGELTVVGNVVRYRVLNIQQYLKTYKASLVDGYRRDIRGKRDSEKIALIRSHFNEIK